MEFGFCLCSSDCEITQLLEIYHQSILNPRPLVVIHMPFEEQSHISMSSWSLIKYATDTFKAEQIRHGDTDL
jgi:hypothetical protein